MEGSFSFSIESVQSLPSSDELLYVDRENERLLKTSAVWHDPVEVEEMDHVSLELRRQDLKINLLLDLVGELLVKHRELPPLETIRLSAVELEFPETAYEIKRGAKAKADLFLLPGFPRALKFYGLVEKSEREGFLSMAFEGLGIGVQDQLEKIIFTHHRRSVAQEHAGVRESNA